MDTDIPSTGKSDKPEASSPSALKRMTAQKQRDTHPELAIRSILHSRGYRYRVDCRPIKALRTRADLVFSGPKVAVFIDGCFWHDCPRHGTLPKANREWWKRMLQRNVHRDRKTDQHLTEVGWTVVRIWEHEDPEEAARRVAEAVDVRTGA